MKNISKPERCPPISNATSKYFHDNNKYIQNVKIEKGEDEDIKQKDVEDEGINKDFKSI